MSLKRIYGKEIDMHTINRILYVSIDEESLDTSEPSFDVEFENLPNAEEMYDIAIAGCAFCVLDSSTSQPTGEYLFPAGVSKTTGTDESGATYTVTTVTVCKETSITIDTDEIAVLAPITISAYTVPVDSE